jgi:hypothetical protein
LWISSLVKRRRRRRMRSNSVTHIAEVHLNFNDYDDGTLSIKCPECNAAATGRCLAPKPGGMGGMVYLPAPHRNRVLVAHGRGPESIWVG